MLARTLVARARMTTARMVMVQHQVRMLSQMQTQPTYMHVAQFHPLVTNQIKPDVSDVLIERNGDWADGLFENTEEEDEASARPTM